MMLYNKNIIMLKIINVFLSRLRKIMQPKDRDEIIFRNRFDKKMQKLFTAAQQHSSYINLNLFVIKNIKIYK